jgi:hypothetical protein
MNSGTRLKKTTLRSAILFALGVNGAALCVGTDVALAGQSAVTCTTINATGGNFTMLTPQQAASYGGNPGYTFGGTNDVAFTWDGTFFDASSDYTGVGSVSNATISSPELFFGKKWTAHDVQIFGPGTYTFNSALANGGANAEAGTITVTVGANQIGAHMLFDWNNNLNIDVVNVWDKNAAFSGCDSATATPTAYNCLWTGSNNTAGNTFSTVWSLASTDNDADGTKGVPMAPGGPFGGYNANFNLPGPLAPANGTCGPSVDTTPDSFSFTPATVTNATFNTTYTSSTITVSGLGVSPPGVGITSSISITGGLYSKNGGAYVNTTDTVINGDTVTVQGISGSANGITTVVALTIGGVSANFTISTPAVVSASGSNFTMLDSSGGVTGGTNDVAAVWDGACDSSGTSTNFSHMTLSSPTPFFQNKWTAHDIRVFCPGTYTIDTTCIVADLHAGTYPCNHLPLPAGQTQQFYTFTVGAGQIGGHMLFDWNNSTNIDVVEVWNQNAVFGPSPMYTGAGACNNSATVWNLMSTDWDGDSKNGGAMIDGPFGGFSANFNIRTSGTPLTCSAYTPTVNVSDPSNTAGCSIGSTPMNVTERADWWFVAGFLAWLGGIQLRLKRKIRS